MPVLPARTPLWCCVSLARTVSGVRTRLDVRSGSSTPPGTRRWPGTRCGSPWLVARSGVCCAARRAADHPVSARVIHCCGTSLSVLVGSVNHGGAILAKIGVCTVRSSRVSSATTRGWKNDAVRVESRRCRGAGPSAVLLLSGAATDGGRAAVVIPVAPGRRWGRVPVTGPAGALTPSTPRGTGSWRACCRRMATGSTFGVRVRVSGDVCAGC